MHGALETIVKKILIRRLKAAVLFISPRRSRHRWEEAATCFLSLFFFFSRKCRLWSYRRSVAEALLRYWGYIRLFHFIFCQIDTLIKAGGGTAIMVLIVESLCRVHLSSSSQEEEEKKKVSARSNKLRSCMNYWMHEVISQYGRVLWMFTNADCAGRAGVSYSSSFHLKDSMRAPTSLFHENAEYSHRAPPKDQTDFCFFFQIQNALWFSAIALYVQREIPITPASPI